MTGVGRAISRFATIPSSSPKQGAGGAAPAGGTGGVPLFWKTSEGGAGGMAAQAKPDPPLNQGAGRNKTPRPGYATAPLQNTNGCAIVPSMKWATSPLLFLGACRIHEYCAHHGESPCGRGAEGTPQGARPSEDGWDRSACRCKAQAYFEPPNSVTARKIGNGSVTTSNGSVTTSNGSVTTGNASVTACNGW